MAPIAKATEPRAYSRLLEIFRRAICRPDIGFNFSAVEMHEIRERKDANND
jgi:hypothetical protein